MPPRPLQGCRAPRASPPPLTGCCKEHVQAGGVSALGKVAACKSRELPRAPLPTARRPGSALDTGRSPPNGLSLRSWGLGICWPGSPSEQTRNGFYSSVTLGGLRTFHTRLQHFIWSPPPLLTVSDIHSPLCCQSGQASPFQARGLGSRQLTDVQVHI